MNFNALQLRIAALQATLPEMVRSETEEWYKDNIRLGIVQKAKGKGTPFTPRKGEGVGGNKYGHPILNETGQLMNSITATYSKGAISVKYKVRNYRGSRDYGFIHNTEGTPTYLGGRLYKIKRPFMKDSRHLIKHLRKLIGLKIKKTL